jgi:hypothetical protein
MKPDKQRRCNRFSKRRREGIVQLTRRGTEGAKGDQREKDIRGDM